MKYAAEVIDLLAAYPGREFRMIQIVRHVSKGMELSSAQRNAMREGVKRVLVQLQDSGQVDKIKEGETSAFYAWRCSLQHGPL